MRKKLILSLLSTLFFQFVEAQNSRDSLAYQIALQLEESFRSSNEGTLFEFWNNDAFMDRVIPDYKNRIDKNKLDETYTVSNAFLTGLLSQVFNHMESGGYYNYVNYYHVDDSTSTLIFRLFGTGGISYHEYILNFPPNNRPFISDIFIYTSGEHASDLVRGIIISEFIDEDNSDNLIAQHYLIFAQIRKLMNENRITEARDLFKTKIPDEARGEKIYKLMELQLMDTNDEESYSSFLENFLGDSKNEAFQYLISLDLFVMKEDYDNALRCVDGLYDYTHDDFLDLFRANIWAGKGNMDSTFTILDRLQANYPLFPEVYDLKMSYLYDQQDWRGIARTLSDLQNNFNLNLSYLDSSLHAEMFLFAESTEYQFWHDSISQTLSGYQEDSRSSELSPYQEELNRKYSDPKLSPLTPNQLKTFTRLDFFPVDDSFIIDASFERNSTLEEVQFQTTTSRIARYRNFGTATFIKDGEEYSLQLFLPPKQARIMEGREYLFIPFNDLTNGLETYGGGRYVECDIPKGDVVTIDFNNSYNPYCAYSDRYSCPIPPRSNFLNMKVTAGIKKFEK